jgi:hypothetical protein
MKSHVFFIIYPLRLSVTSVSFPHESYLKTIDYSGLKGLQQKNKQFFPLILILNLKITTLCSYTYWMNKERRSCLCERHSGLARGRGRGMDPLLNLVDRWK